MPVHTLVTLTAIPQLIVPRDATQQLGTPLHSLGGGARAVLDAGNYWKKGWKRLGVTGKRFRIQKIEEIFLFF